MNVLSLFDGISCGRVALERAGIQVDTYNAFEIDEYAIKIAQKNYPKTIQNGDVLESDFAKFRNADLLMGGSPCTFWSIAKNNREIDKNGMGWKLFERYLLAMKNTNSKHFLYENVASMPNTIKDFISEELGCDPIMIDSKLVSAQQRKRYYWTNIPCVTQPEDKNILLENVVESDALVDRVTAHAVLASIGRTTHREYFMKNQGQLVYLAIMLSNIYGGFKEDKPRVHLSKSVTIRTAKGGGHIPSLIINNIKKEFNVNEIKDITRKVTPLECERLQTLPDNYTEGISNTQRYKCIGNGWTVDVIAHILSFIKN